MGSDELGGVGGDSYGAQPSPTAILLRGLSAAGTCRSTLPLWECGANEFIPVGDTQVKSRRGEQSDARCFILTAAPVHQSFRVIETSASAVSLTLRYRIKFRPRCSRHQLAFGGSDMHTCTALHREQL